MTNLQSNKYFIAMMVVGIFLLYMYMTDQLTQEILFGGTAAAFVLFLMMNEYRREIDLIEAEQIGYDRIKDLQRAGRIENGTITILPEAELKNFVTEGTDMPEIVSHKFDIVYEIDTGRGSDYVIIAVDKFGAVIGNWTAAKRPSAKDTSPEFRKINATPSNYLDESQRRAREKERERGSNNGN